MEQRNVDTYIKEAAVIADDLERLVAAGNKVLTEAGVHAAYEALGGLVIIGATAKSNGARFLVVERLMARFVTAILTLNARELAEAQGLEDMFNTGNVVVAN